MTSTSIYFRPGGPGGGPNGSGPGPQLGSSGGQMLPQLVGSVGSSHTISGPSGPDSLP